MTEEHQKLLQAMLEARRAYDAAEEAQRAAWQVYLDAQAAFTGKFAKTDCPLGPFVCGTVLIEHKYYSDEWPEKRPVFEYRDVIRCHTSE